MSRFVVTSGEAKAWHVGQMVRLLREEHATVLRKAEVPTHRELRDAFAFSIVRRAWFIDGRLVALAGLISTLAESEGTIWVALAQRGMDHPVAVARGALRFVEEMGRTKHRLMTLILPEDRASLSLAYFLGFKVERAELTVHGAAAKLMSYTSSPQRKAA